MSEATLDMSGLKTVEMITVRERNAEDSVSQSIYDDKGVIVGQLSDEDFETRKARYRGMTYFEGRAKVDGNVFLFRSAIVEHEQRAGAMTEMFAYIGSNLFTHFFGKK